MTHIRQYIAVAICGLVLLGPVLPASAPADEQAKPMAKHARKVDRAVDKALKYLARQQKKDGSYPAALSRNTGIASLCVMAYLSKGYTPGTGPYGKTINRGIDFVLDSQQKNGMLVAGASHGPMYSHTISTLMLSEVSGMVDPARQKRIDEALGRALKLIVEAQKVDKPEKHAGGWRYQHTSKDSDISLTGWALMSLRSARGNGASVPKQAIDRALAFVMRCRGKDGGYTYQPNDGKETGFARTGTALLCLELCRKHRSEPALAAGDYILKNLPKKFGGNYFYYGVYYCSQGMFQLGGKYWSGWGEYMIRTLLENQKKDGSWPTGSGAESKAGECYATAMCVLALNVSYRQLPIYQR